ncbi:hypothetical protein EV361DRAFT_882807 [Lentinula raphanica]|uniref:Uncharacterized protein n=1 Tax=Lentinula raphanica TaxID=153919 RepID=A0AA38PHL6_9AGAR|nr:hypothetical protein F5878DRAFT_707026 [Lentinula raphanica]KAJ3976616.1 hypothetical protein EV361DRAFT_882807 [Lentinula raphanica]
MNNQRTRTDSGRKLGSSPFEDNRHSQYKEIPGGTPIWQLPYFPPLSPDDEFEIHDLELVFDNEKKQTEILARPRAHSLARATYKIQKHTHRHFLGKKHFDILISRLDSWDSIRFRPIQSQSSHTGKSYIALFEAMDQSPRHIHLVPTKCMVLSNTARGGDICLTPYCGPYDPQRNRATQPRNTLGYHFLPLHTTDFEHSPRSPAVPGQHITSPYPVALTKPYSGGGYLLFDAHSRGRADLLSTLYCTGYECRCAPRPGDIVLAELRLSRPATEPEVNVPSWRRLFRERHVSLFMSKRGIDAVFSGSHVNMFVPKSVETHRYSLTSGQAQEIIISLFATSLLAIEHEGLDSKKWSWLLSRQTLELGDSSKDMVHTPHTPEKTPHPYSEREFQDTDSTSFTDVIHTHTHPYRARTPDHHNWRVMTYHSSLDMGDESVSQPPSDSAHSSNDFYTGEVKTTSTEYSGTNHTSNHADIIHKSRSQHLASYSPRTHRRASMTPEKTLDSSEGHIVVDSDQPPVPPRIWPKEGPKVTGKPKPGVEGGIYW